MRIAWRRRLVGLDIGASAVKAVELRRRRGRCALAARAVTPLPTGAVESGRIADAGAVAAAVRETLAQPGFRARRSAVSVARNAVIVRRITLPAMSAGELDAAIRWEAPQHIPFPAADVALDYHRLPAVADGRSDVLLVAARRDRVAEYTDVVAAAGCPAAVVDTGAFALLNAWAPGDDAEATRPTAMLDVGATSTGVTVTAGGRPLAVRELPLGVQTYLDALRSAGDPGAAAAERVVRGDAAGDESPPALQPVHARLAAEVGRALDVAREQVPDAGAVVLSGGAAGVPGLAAALASELQVAVSVLDPFRRVDCNGVAGDLDGPRAAVAVGLALRRGGDR